MTTICTLLPILSNLLSHNFLVILLADTISVLLLSHLTHVYKGAISS